MRSWIKTKDGSLSLYVEELDETYHSRHGAVTESKHVFIESGLAQFPTSGQLNLLEVGFGTGTNCMLTIEQTLQRNIHYQALEPHPLTSDEWEEVAKSGLPLLDKSFLKSISECASSLQVSENFLLTIHRETLQDVVLEANHFDLVYYDAFGPRAQPEMWTVDCFQKLYKAMRQGGVLVTYCAKGQVRRDMQSCGFKVERLPGPPGKREMIRAIK